MSDYQPTLSPTFSVDMNHDLKKQTKEEKIHLFCVCLLFHGTGAGCFHPLSLFVS